MVSVCIPTYNYAGFLPEAIDSVLKQVFTDYEILIIDDCSHDNTKEVVSGYAIRDKRIRFLINPVNGGMVNNWNLCLAEARGEHIKFVFGGDLLSSPGALQKMVSLLDADRPQHFACSVGKESYRYEFQDYESISTFQRQYHLAGRGSYQPMPV